MVAHLENFRFRQFLHFIIKEKEWRNWWIEKWKLIEKWKS